MDSGRIHAQDEDIFGRPVFLTDGQEGLTEREAVGWGFSHPAKIPSTTSADFDPPLDPFLVHTGQKEASSGSIFVKG